FARVVFVLPTFHITTRPPMNKHRKRLWVGRLGRLPQSAVERISQLFEFIPPALRLYLSSLLLILATTVLVSQFRLSPMTEYRAGDVVREDVILPLDLELVPSGGPRSIQESNSRQIARSASRVVLRAGEVVTDEVVPILDAVRRHHLSQRQPRRLVGLFVLVALVFFALYRTSMIETTVGLSQRRAYWVAATAVAIQMVLVRIGMFSAAVLSTRAETNWFGDGLIFQFGIPLAGASLVVSILVGSRLALVVALFTSLFVGLLSPLGMIMSGYAVAGSMTAVFSVQRYRSRNAITQASLAIAGVNVVAGIAALLSTDYDMSWQAGVKVAIAGAAGGLVTAAVASFGTPIYESLFGILTDIKLLELSNAELPLLRQLAIQTPGTNHHSFVVGSLAEAAAKAIGANALLARVGCLYHDIGKLAAPKMYIENQAGAANPHDRVSPRDSVRIITGHVRRGLQMAEDANLPQQIIDFIPQHHGTRVLAYFFHKAKSQADATGETVDIEDFRYPGPKPQSKEAVILMLADGSEAAVRSLEEPTPENIGGIVSKIVDTVIADGQLEECDITFREIGLIRESLINALIGMYHHRISYPGFNPPSEAARRDAGTGPLSNPSGHSGDPAAANPAKADESSPQAIARGRR
ncbi:MAG: HDIG domain-containing metalloprotein, partial [Acidobacteriota bacterium]